MAIDHTSSYDVENPTVAVKKVELSLGCKSTFVLLRILRVGLYKRLSMPAGRMASVYPVKPELSGTGYGCVVKKWDI